MCVLELERKTIKNSLAKILRNCLPPPPHQTSLQGLALFNEISGVQEDISLVLYCLSPTTILAALDGTESVNICNMFFFNHLKHPTLGTRA